MTLVSTFIKNRLSFFEKNDQNSFSLWLNKSNRLGKLQENKKRNETTIINAAYELFVNKGLDSTTISDIVKGSKLARGTFYNYFQSKEEIWDLIVKKLVENVNARLIEERKNANDIYEFTYNAFLGYAHVLQENKYLDLLIRNQANFRKSVFSAGLLNSIYAYLEKDIANSPYYNGLTMSQIQLISYSMIGSAIELIIQAHLNQQTTSMEELGKYFADLFIGGYERIISKSRRESQIK